MKKEDLRYCWRAILLIQRAKDGGHNRPDYHAHKMLVFGPEEYQSALDELRLLRDTKTNKESWRIYASVNARNIEKAIRHFKFDQLEADYYDEANRYKFYSDISNRWFGAIMKPQSRDETKFLIDVDHNEGEDIDLVLEALMDARVEVIFEYKTKNGWHIITKPYNTNLTPQLEIKKDALLFIE